MRFFDESLDLSIEEEEVDYIAELFTTQLLNSFDSTCNDIDYVNYHLPKGNGFLFK